MSVEQTVFVVDDEKAVRESVAALLRAHKIPVELFASAHEFLNAYDAQRSGCLIADMRLEDGMSGLELQQVLIDRGIQLPIIMITGHAEEKSVTTALLNGALCVLKKPVPYKELMAQIRGALQKDAERRKPKPA